MSNVQLFNGDCLEIMKHIPDKSVDMILCDLPYGTTACKWDSVIPFDELWKQYKRIIKDNGAIVLFGSEPFSSFLRTSGIDLYKYDFIWHKSRPTGFAQAKNQPLRDYENVCVFSKGNAIHASQTKNRMVYNPQGLMSCHIEKKQGNKNGKTDTCFSNRKSHKNVHLQECTNYPRQVIAIASESKTVHPTQKPVALCEYLVKTYTNLGDTILDNCMGSGTTGVACKNLGRDFIGIELDKNYFDIAQQRIESQVQQLEFVGC